MAAFSLYGLHAAADDRAGSSVTFTWYATSDTGGGAIAAPAGITATATASTTDVTNTTIAITATSETTAHTYYFTATIDGTPSNVATLTISEPLSSIGAITGTAKVGSTLTAGAVTPDVTVTYQWQRADTSTGSYADITDATSSTYTLVAADEGKYIKVVATANASGYTGSVTSAASDVVAPADYTLSIGSESTAASGVGRSRTITVGGAQKDNLSGKYLVVAITEGSGDTAKVSVVMFELTKSPANISYQTAGASVEAWLVNTSDMPSFTGEAITGDFVAHAQAN